MRRLLILGGALMFLAACTPFQEAYYVDKEFGQATQAAFDQQIINRDSPYENQVPVGLEGVTAEEIMNVHNKTFAERPRKSSIFEFDMGGSH